MRTGSPKVSRRRHWRVQWFCEVDQEFARSIGGTSSTMDLLIDVNRPDATEDFLDRSSLVANWNNHRPELEARDIKTTSKVADR